MKKQDAPIQHLRLNAEPSKATTKVAARADRFTWEADDLEHHFPEKLPAKKQPSKPE